MARTRKYIIKVYRRHFPEKLDSKTIGLAYLGSTDMMELAISEVIPDFRERYFIGVHGLVCVRPEHWYDPIEEVGEVEGWESIAAKEIAEKLQKDETYCQEFILKYKPR